MPLLSDILAEICYSQETVVVVDVIKHVPVLSRGCQSANTTPAAARVDCHRPRTDAPCQTRPSHVQSLLPRLGSHRLVAKVDVWRRFCETSVADVERVPVERRLTPQGCVRLIGGFLPITVLQQQQQHRLQ